MNKKTKENWFSFFKRLWSRSRCKIEGETNLLTPKVGVDYVIT